MKQSIIIRGVFVTSVALFVNCKTEDIVEIPETFPVEKALTHEAYQIEGLIDPIQYTVAGNYLFLMGMKSEPIFQQYKLPELTYVKSFGTRGRGPGEFINPRMSVSPDFQTLYIKNSAKFNIYRIAENGDLISGSDIKFPRDALYNQFYIVNDSLLMYDLGTEDMGIGKINLQTRELNKVQLDKNYDGEFFMNTERGSIAINNKYIVYAYLYRKQIDIYNIDDMSLKVRLKAKGRQYITPPPIERDSPAFYRSVCATEQYIYAFCVNPYSDDEDNKRYVEVFDYEGTPLKRYNLGGYFTLPYVVSPDDSAIYTYNSQFDDKILKFDFE